MGVKQEIIGKNYIIWNNFNTKDNGILIEQLDIPPKPEERKELITIDGRNGFLTKNYDCYSSIQYTVQLNLYEYGQAERVKDVFGGSGELILSCCPNVVYKATIINSIDFERVMYQKRICAVTFELQPLAYVRNVSDIQITLSTTITNNYNAKAYPYIKIIGTGSGNLYINNHTISFIAIDEYVEMDSELEECYKDTVNCNKNMIGDFVVLEKGDTTISFDGNITQVIINPRWRTL